MEAQQLTSLPGVDLHLLHLPAYAKFLLDHHLEEYARALLQCSRQLQLPILKYLEGLSENQLDAIGKARNAEMLTLFAQNKAEEIIENSVTNWVANRLPIIHRDLVVAEDIVLVSYSRRKVLREFLSRYTTDVHEFGAIMQEIDRFTVALDTNLLNAFIQYEQEKIKGINASLRQRESELLEAQDIGQIGSFEWDLAGKNSVYTPQVYKIFEIEKVTTMQSFMSDVHPDDQQKLAACIQSALRDGTLDCEYRYTRNNHEKVLWCRGRAVFDGLKPVRLTGTIMDITERSRIVERLTRSESLYKQAQAITHIGNWSWDFNSDEVRWSDEMFRIYGLMPQAESITVGRFLSFVHPDDEVKGAEEIRHSIESLVAKEYVFRIIAADGQVKVLRGRGEIMKDVNNKPATVMGTCQDITKEFHLNQAVEEREAYLDQLLKNAPDAIIVINERSEIILWNPRTEAIFGWKAEEVLNKNLVEIIIPDRYRAEHKRGMKHFLRTGEGRLLNNTIEIEALNRKGEEFFISLTISQSVQSDRPIFIAFIRDITKERKIATELGNKTRQLAWLNKSLELKNQELVRTNQELESFNFIASHDLQEPLRKIKIFSDRLLSDTQNRIDDDSRSYLEKVHQAAGRMQDLIDDFLEFSKAVSAPKDFETTDLREIIEEIESDLAVTLEEKKAAIELGELPKVQAIRYQIRQLMINLITNSLKYSRENTPVKIRITSQDVDGKDIAQSRATKDETYHAISISDNGIGFEQKYAEKIFELFQRLHTKDQFSGTGIGLAICKKIVENHEGFIEAEGTPGVGAKFTIYLPTKHSAKPA
jgi:PAS domain S-box-containing protein